MVPKGWASLQLGKIMSFKNGLNFTKTDNGDSVKIVGVGDFKDFTELTSTEHLELISVAGRIRDEELLNNGDLLFVRSNGNKDLIGRCMFFPEVRERLSFSGFTIRGRVINEGALPAYMAIVARSSQFQTQISKASGGTNISNLSQKILNDINLLLPPLIEQKKIAQILSAWDKAISVTEKILTNSQQQKKALMQQLLTGKKRLLDENGVRFSGKWKQLSLRVMADIIVSPVDKKTDANEIPVELCNYTDVYYNNFITNDINFMKATATKAEIEKYTIKKGDVIITKDSETPGDIAIPALVSENLNGVVCGYHLAIIRPRSEFIIGAFLNYLFAMQKTRYYFFTLATGATRFGLSVGGITHAHFNIPEIVEQQKIAAVLSAADAEISTLEKKLACLKDEKKALMQQLLTGKRRVKIDEAVAA